LNVKRKSTNQFVVCHVNWKLRNAEGRSESRPHGNDDEKNEFAAWQKAPESNVNIVNILSIPRLIYNLAGFLSRLTRMAADERGDVAKPEILSGWYILR
jgi:hypothetical protein